MTELESQRIADQVRGSDPSPLTTANLLREIRHLRELLENQTGALRSEFGEYKTSHEATHREVVAASTTHLHDLLDAALREVLVRLEERDKRYNQRYIAQTKAVDAAFNNQQLATQAALAAADKAVRNALEAAEQAVAKAEALNEKRFHSFTAIQEASAVLGNHIERLRERVEGLDHITDAKFVTFRALMDSQAEKVALALAASDKAVSKAEAANERRFESVNEFRSTLADQASTFISRTEAAASTGALSARVDASFAGIDTSMSDLKARMDRNEGRSGGFASSGAILVGAVGFLATLIAIVTGIILVLN